MAARFSSEQETIPVDYEAQKATKKEPSIPKSINIPDIFIYGFAVLGGYGIINFIYTEAVNFIKELGQ